jgi:hypothetical protein
MRVLWLVWVVLVVGCVDLAEERAKNEDQIGQRAAAGLRVAVQDGLATVRVLEPGQVTLWAQAPSLSIDLDAEAPGAWVLEVHNALSDAQLTGAPATPLERERPTHKAWRVTLPAGATRLTLVAPRAMPAEPFKIIAFADTQEALPEAADYFRRMAEVPDVHFGLVSGDLTRGRPPMCGCSSATCRCCPSRCMPRWATTTSA